MGQDSQTEEESSGSGRSRERIDRKEESEAAREQEDSINHPSTRTGGATIHRTTGAATVASARSGPGGGATPGTVSYDTGPEVQRLSADYGIDFHTDDQAQKVQRLEKEFGSHKVQRWADEGMTVDTMGKPQDMEAFRKRKAERSDEIPADIERQNQASYQRNVHRAGNTADSSDISESVEHLHDVGELRGKLEVSSPNDPAEKEAERVADKVMKMGTPKTENSESGSDSNSEEVATEKDRESSHEPIRESISTHRSSDGSEVTEGAEQDVKGALNGGGKPLPSTARSYFEPRFGADFSNVNIHTGSEANKAARSINAKAFTMGNDVAFAKGNYDPSSRSGKELLAHELTHVVQQNPGVDRSQEVYRESSGDGVTRYTDWEWTDEYEDPNYTDNFNIDVDEDLAENATRLPKIRDTIGGEGISSIQAYGGSRLGMEGRGFKALAGTRLQDAGRFSSDEYKAGDDRGGMWMVNSITGEFGFTGLNEPIPNSYGIENWQEQSSKVASEVIIDEVEEHNDGEGRKMLSVDIETAHAINGTISKTTEGSIGAQGGTSASAEVSGVGVEQERGVSASISYSETLSYDASSRQTQSKTISFIAEAQTEVGEEEQD